jgi:hypothetical protein
MAADSTHAVAFRAAPLELLLPRLLLLSPALYNQPCSYSHPPHPTHAAPSSPLSFLLLAQVDIDTVEKFEALRAAEQQYFIDMVTKCKEAGECVRRSRGRPLQTGQKTKLLL